MKKILIVDDEPTILLTLSHVLKGKNNLIITSSRMEEAEEALRHYDVDLMIADIRLSGMDGIEGLELLSYVKQINDRTGVIVMTAYGSDEMRQEAYRRGALHYFEKPVDILQFIETVMGIGIEIEPKHA